MQTAFTFPTEDQQPSPNMELEKQQIAYHFVNVYYGTLYEWAPDITPFLILHTCPAARSDAGERACSSSLQPENYRKQRTFQTKEFAVEIDCVHSRESVERSIVAMVVGTAYSHACVKYSFSQTFVIERQQNGDLSVCNDMLWYHDEIDVPTADQVPANFKVCSTRKTELASATSAGNDFLKDKERSHEERPTGGPHCSAERNSVLSDKKLDPHGEIMLELVHACKNRTKSQQKTEHSCLSSHTNGHMSNEDIREGTISTCNVNEQIGQAEIASEETAHEPTSGGPGSHEDKSKPQSCTLSERPAEKAIDEATLLKDAKTSDSIAEDLAIFNEEAFPSLLTATKISLAPSTPTKTGCANQKDDVNELVHRLSYASIANGGGGGKFETDSPTATFQKSYVRSPPIQAAVATVSTDVKTSSKHEGCVFLRNLPSNINVTTIYNELKLFGVLKFTDIDIRYSQGRPPFAFVKFKDAISAQKAIQASPVTIDGQKVAIEERRSVLISQRWPGAIFDNGSNGRTTSDNKRGT